MNEQIYLSCQIVEETRANRTVVSKLFDGTQFRVTVPYWDVIPIEGDPSNAGWLRVELLGTDEDNQKVLVKLPSPSLNLGHNVNVSKGDVTKVYHGTVEKMASSE